MNRICPRGSRLTGAHADRRGDAGFSLVELLVVMVLFGIVGTVLTTSAIQAQRTINSTDVLLREVTQARTAMVEVSRVVRTVRRESPTADQFVNADGSSVTFYTNFRHDAAVGPKLVRIGIEDDQLVEYIQEAIADTAAATGFRHEPITSGTRRILVRDLTNTDIFTYLTRTGDPVVAPDQPGGPMVVRIDVRLEVGGPPVRNAPTVVTQQIRLPNFLRG